MRQIIGLVLALFAAFGGIDIPDKDGGGVSPAGVAGIARDAAHRRSAILADAYAALAGQVEAREITKADQLKSAIAEAAEQADQVAAQPLQDSAASTLPADAIDDADAVESWLMSVAEGFREASQ